MRLTAFDHVSCMVGAWWVHGWKWLPAPMSILSSDEAPCRYYALAALVFSISTGNIPVTLAQAIYKSILDSLH